MEVDRLPEMAVETGRASAALVFRSSPPRDGDELDPVAEAVANPAMRGVRLLKTYIGRFQVAPPRMCCREACAQRFTVQVPPQVPMKTPPFPPRADVRSIRDQPVDAVVFSYFPVPLTVFHIARLPVSW